MKYTPHNYQDHAERHLMAHPFAGLFMDMGLGKTVVTLTAIDRLLKSGDVRRPLVIAPKRVASDTWTDEAEKWDHLRHLKIVKVLGTERQRKAALLERGDIHIINRENVAWLVSHYGQGFPFDMLVIDELSSFKSTKAIRFRSLRKVRPLLKRVVGLTGTPRPNGLLDLWPQLYLIDHGERLGTKVTEYRKKYFIPGRSDGHVVYNYDLKKGEDDLLGAGIYEREIYDKIGDICISMRARDYLDLPERIDTILPVHLSADIWRQYKQFEKDQVMAIADAEITALSAVALYNKLLQFCNGAVYDEDGNYHEIHTEKLEALAERIEAAQGDPVLVLYQFRHDLDRIKGYLRKYKPVHLQSGKDVRDWNNGDIQVLAGHPASMGHGLNMQKGGYLLEWLGRPWSSELWLQTIARLDRQGQTRPVVNNTIIIKGSIDEKVVGRIGDKVRGQEGMMAAIRAIVEEYK